MTLGQKIRQARKARGITQRQLAGGDLSESFISMLEHDKVRPSLETLRILAARLGTPLAELLEAEPAPPARVVAALGRGSALLRQHQFTPALEAFQDAERVIGPDAPLEYHFRIQIGLGQALVGLRQFDLARQALDRARLLADSLGRPDLTARVASATGFLHLRLRDFSAARDAFTRALSAIRSVGPVDAEFEGAVLTNLGRTYSELGLPAQALDCFQAALQRLEPLGDVGALGLLHFNLGVAHERQRAFEQARAHLERAAVLFEAQENLRLLGTVKRSLGILLLNRGLPDQGAEVLAQSLAVAERLADDVGRAQTLTELARASLMRGDLKTAQSRAEEAIRLAVRLQDPAEAARAEAVMAVVCWRDGRLPEAARRFEYALQQFERLHLAGEVARTSRDYAFLLMERGEEAAAARHFARAFRAQETAGVAD
ncbi:MAG: helix-turn-helix transcriptional regulator [Armatimonadota bacterium]|nr:helix-turn-helix transcriptional regulator [Armatimonadota bacterium]MDR7485994.1 helix-turn-helix transcriptional regulator [Armatimonadota bacterium]MDR7532565.1 helix-turn-helix transcriptional regulator [Armatimonadota bacterium]MDR7536226.1 helix-turn-helix transcriptional regulator [Armatimonadota bacterium]